MSIVLLGSTSGSITLQEPAVAGTNTLNLPAVTGTFVIAGQNSAITAGTVNAGGANPFNNTLANVDFTGIPSWIKRVTVMFNAFSTNGTSNILVQLISASGVKSTGYSSSAATTAGTTSTSTSGFIITGAVAAANTHRGNIVLVLQTGNEWVSTGILDVGGSLNTSGGSVNLAETLTGIRITTAGGANFFDAGSINILYE